MSETAKILFVCTGNICRSAMAEHLLRHYAKVKDLPLEVRSCGTAADPRYEVPAVVRRLLAEKGVPPFEHSSRLITREDLAWADVVLAMSDDHLTDLRSLFPEFKAKTRLFRKFAGFGDESVADPMGRSDEEFGQCFEVIDEALERLIERGFK